MQNTQDQVQALLDQAVLQKIGSAAAAAWGDLEFQQPATQVFAGQANQKTIFDLASLTKLFAMTSLYMLWDEQGIVSVDDFLATHLPEEVRAHPHLQGIKIRHLLAHTSGLPAHRDFYLEITREFGQDWSTASRVGRKNSYFKKVFSTPLESAVGLTVIYSDLGPSLLFYLAEKIGRERWGLTDFNDLIQAQVLSLFKKCGQKDELGLHFRPIHTGLDQQEVAMTELCPWRGQLQGEVHDDNCWSIGGVAAHAGLFGNLESVVAWVQALVSGKLVSLKTLRKFSAPESIFTGEIIRALGFDLPARDGSGSTGFYFTAGAIGHLGFTGTSLWIDLDANRFAVLLTNRVYPSRADLRIRKLRRLFHSFIS